MTKIPKLPDFLNRKLNPVKVTRTYTKSVDSDIKSMGRCCREARIKYNKRKAKDNRASRKRKKEQAEFETVYKMTKGM